MSKSTGNITTIRELLKRYHPEVIRFFILRAHYRSPLDYSDQHLQDARHALSRLYTALRGTPVEAAAPDWDESHGQRFREVMDNDFNTPEAVAVLFDLANQINRANSTALARQLRALGRLLGLLGLSSEEFLRAEIGAGGGISDEQVASLIAARYEARRDKDFRRADEIRDDLLRRGIALEDGPRGTSWRRV